MSTKFKLDQKIIAKNIESVQSYMAQNNIETFYVSSFDAYLNEYVPMTDCHRFYITGFTGSVAEALIPKTGKVKIYVDGRYHEQADLECDKSLVEVVKVQANQGVLNTLKLDLEQMNPKNIAIEADRTSVGFFDELKDKYDVKILQNNELATLIDFVKAELPGKITHLDISLSGATTQDKLKNIFKFDHDAYFVTAIDSLSWITNCRGYHLPNLSSFLGTGLVLKDKVYVFIAKGIEVDCSDAHIEFIHCDGSELADHLNTITKSLSLKNIFIDKGMLNTQNYLILESVFGKDKLISKPGGLVEFHSIKNPGEIKAMKDSFRRGDRAIFNTIKWVKSEVSAGKKVSELDLYNKTSEMYEKEGAITQSFGTISGAGANGSIIHYSDPKADVFIKEDTMVLLDSGGYFASGFATDTTRTFLGGAKCSDEKYKKIYTLVLKGTLNLQNAVFKPETKGMGLDAICRQPLYQEGYDFAHGTGHGVGIHVHEGGVGIGPTRNYILKPGQVVSIEPGIYIPGFGGVRLENIGLIKEHPVHKGFLCFESLVNIGFEHGLIDLSLLSEQEKKWLNEYEDLCAKNGTSFLN